MGKNYLLCACEREREKKERRKIGPFKKFCFPFIPFSFSSFLSIFVILLIFFDNMHPSDFGQNRSRIPPVDRNSSVDGKEALFPKFMQKKIRSWHKLLIFSSLYVSK
jgi:hypothetical protein